MNRVTKLIVFEEKKKYQSCINVHLHSGSKTLFLEIEYFSILFSKQVDSISCIYVKL